MILKVRTIQLCPEKASPGLPFSRLHTPVVRRVTSLSVCFSFTVFLFARCIFSGSPSLHEREPIIDPFCTLLFTLNSFSEITSGHFALLYCGAAYPPTVSFHQVHCQFVKLLNSFTSGAGETAPTVWGKCNRRL